VCAYREAVVVAAAVLGQLKITEHDEASS
jgi:hypothetical protein